MKVLRIAMSGTVAAPGGDAIERVLRRRGAAHELQDARARVLEGDVEIRQHPALGHELDALDRRADTG